MREETLGQANSSLGEGQGDADFVHRARWVRIPGVEGGTDSVQDLRIETRCVCALELCSALLCMRTRPAIPRSIFEHKFELFS